MYFISNSNFNKTSVVLTRTNKPYVQNLIIFEIHLLLTDALCEFDPGTGSIYYK